MNTTEKNIARILNYHLTEMDKYDDFNLKEKARKAKEYRHNNKKSDEPSQPINAVASKTGISIS